MSMKDIDISVIIEALRENTAGVQALQQTIADSEARKIAGSSKDPNQTTVKEFEKKLEAFVYILQKAGADMKEIKAFRASARDAAIPAIRAGVQVSDDASYALLDRKLNEAINKGLITITKNMEKNNPLAKQIKTEYKKDVMRQADTAGLKNLPDKIQYLFQDFREWLGTENKKGRKRLVDDLLEGLSKNSGIMGVFTDILKLVTLLGASWLKQFGTLGSVLGAALLFVGPSLAKMLGKAILQGLGGLGSLIGKGLIRAIPLLGRALPLVGAVGSGFGLYDSFKKGDKAGVGAFGVSTLAFALAPFLGPGAPIAVAIGVLTGAVGLFHKQIGDILENFFPGIGQKFTEIKDTIVTWIRNVISVIPGGQKLLDLIDSINGKLEQNEENYQRAQYPQNNTQITPATGNFSASSKNVADLYKNASPAQKRVADKIIAEAKRQDVDPNLALALAWQESGWSQTNKNGRTKKSSAGALGVMQLMPGTAKSLGVNPYDENDNIRGGISYLRNALIHYNGDGEAVVASYNAGIGAVDDYLNGTNKTGQNPRHRKNFRFWDPTVRQASGYTGYKETVGYVRNIESMYLGTPETITLGAAETPVSTSPVEAQAQAQPEQQQEASHGLSDKQKMEAALLDLTIYDSNKEQKSKYEKAVKDRDKWQERYDRNKAEWEKDEKLYGDSFYRKVEEPIFKKILEQKEEEVKKHAPMVPGYEDYDPTGSILSSRLLQGISMVCLVGADAAHEKQ